eukprot:gnl/TRDRNA2_/TRDRNA2_161242_c0_seq1.p2 gnl/TRDRNA2_/TRDRNA2_161242_c0~~gnl/TRDRNA2_/TRDRNA2_161242_c0_seq1.p2  ORF type:complete len:285 (-),score=60.43 gnl/TRDRNA2_/TRDRNA2_161242_c0_seq1:145-909(-)
MSWVKNNNKNARFNPNKRDDFLVMGEVISRRPQKVTAKQKEAEKDEADAVTIDLAEIVSKNPKSRLKWLQRALMQAGRGKLVVNTLYDLISHPKFITDVKEGTGAQMKASILANLHLFSSKQQKYFKSDQSKFSSFADVKSEAADNSKRAEEADDSPENEKDAKEAAPTSRGKRKRSSSKKRSKKARSASRSGSRKPQRHRSKSGSGSRKPQRKRSRSSSSKSDDRKQKKSQKDKDKREDKKASRSRSRSRRRK